VGKDRIPTFGSSFGAGHAAPGDIQITTSRHLLSAGDFFAKICCGLGETDYEKVLLNRKIPHG
jgi:hypothetical protein